MNPETLERLLIDRETGMLPPDVEVLLAAYLEGNDDAARLAAETCDTVELARAALCEQRPSSLPAFPIGTFERTLRQRRRVWRMSYAGGMAACLLIGLGVGWFAFRSAPSAPVPTPQVIVVEAPAETQPLAQANTSEFWSVKQWLERAEQRSPRRRSEHVVWESPVSPPRLMR